MKYESKESCKKNFVNKIFVIYSILGQKDSTKLSTLRNQMGSSHQSQTLLFSLWQLWFMHKKKIWDNFQPPNSKKLIVFTLQT
jgi:hypothetical protein